MTQIIEISIYLVLFAMLNAYRTVLSGRKNGCFYHKNDPVKPPMLAQAIRNIHFLETPAWFTQSAMAFVTMLAINRMTNYTTNLADIGLQAGIALLYMAGNYQMPSYHFQRGITAGLKDDDHLDVVLETEVAIVVFGRKIQFWRGRLFSNKRRKLAQWLGVFWVVASVVLFVYFSLLKNTL